MVDIQEIAREIGLFETGINLSKVRGSADVLQKVGASMPLPDENIAEEVPRIASWLCSFGKSQYMFLTPEIALIEEIAKLVQAEIIIAIPCDLEVEAKKRLRNNIPQGINVTFLEEPHYPQLRPKDGMMVVCGYFAGGRTMVFSDTYRMFEHYGSRFYGQMVFIPYKELDTADRYDGWMEFSQQMVFSNPFRMLKIYSEFSS